MTEAGKGGMRTVLPAVGPALMGSAARTGGDYTDNGVNCSYEGAPPTIHRHVHLTRGRSPLE